MQEADSTPKNRGVVYLEGRTMRGSVRTFLIGLLLGIAATVAVTEEKIAFAQTEEGFKITCNARFIEKNRELPRQIAEFAERTWRQ